MHRPSNTFRARLRGISASHYRPPTLLNRANAWRIAPGSPCGPEATIVVLRFFARKLRGATKRLISAVHCMLRGSGPVNSAVIIISIEISDVHRTSQRTSLSRLRGERASLHRWRLHGRHPVRAAIWGTLSAEAALHWRAVVNFQGGAAVPSNLDMPAMVLLAHTKPVRRVQKVRCGKSDAT
jgi:hypothetical protein